MWRHDGSGGSAIWLAESEPVAPNAGLSTAELLEKTRKGQLVTNSGKTTLNDNDLRADSANSLVDDFGLMRRIHRDDADRKITEFELAPGATKIGGWMKPYVAQAQRAMVWNHGGRTKEDMTSAAASRLATERHIASGGRLPAFDVAGNLAELMRGQE